MRVPILAALALSLAPPALAQAQDPYQAGVDARRSGDNVRAARLLGSVVRADPRNADAQLQLGLSLLALGRLDEAEAAFRRTLALAPDYADARIGLARVAQRRGDRTAGLAALEGIGPENAEAAGLRQQLSAGSAPAATRWRLDLDGSYSALDGQEDWKESSARLAYQVSADTTLSGGIEAARRFGLTDTYGELRLDRRLPGGSSVYAFAGGTPNADFRPEWQLGAGGALRVTGGPNPTLLTLDARQARYRAGDIQTLNPGIDQYVFGGRAWLSARWINIFDESGRRQSGWLARGDAMASPKLRVFAGAADAPDVSEGVVTDIFSLFGGLSYDVSDRMAIRASVAHEDRERGADRLQFGLGAGWKF